MNEATKKLLIDGIGARKQRLENRLRNVLSQKYALIDDYPGGLVPFLQELQKEIDTIRNEIEQLEKMRRENE